MSGKSVRLEFPVTADNYDRAGEASGKIKKALQHLGVPSSVVRRIAIGSYEAEINEIIHAGGGKLVLEVYPDHTRVEAVDSGPGIPDVEKAMEAGYSTAPEAARALGFGAGMGLPNMKSCSDRLDIQTMVGFGTTVIMEFDHK